MNKRVILCTLPGTGTHFFKKLLEDHGVECRAIHCTAHGLGIVTEEVVNGSILVTTYRNSMEVLESWEENGRKLDELEYLRGWYSLFQYEPVVVSFGALKERRLELLSAVLGIELKTDWEPVNATQ